MSAQKRFHTGDAAVMRLWKQRTHPPKMLDRKAAMPVCHS
jgi:hypothetical protein